MKKYLLPLLLLFSAHAYSQNAISYQNWAVQFGPQTVEAYTTSESNYSMGLFCGGNQCSFYLNTNTNCQPDTKYHVLINSAAVSTSIAMKCTQVGNRYFQVLEPFNIVLNALKSGDVVGFALAVDSGQFIVAKFSLAGASEAASRALSETANRAKTLPKNTPPINLPNQSKSKPLIS